MKIVEMIRTDKEIQDMKQKIKELSGKNAPPFSYDQDGSIDKYKDRLRRLCEIHEGEKNDLL